MTIRQARATDLPAVLAVEKKGICNPWSAGQLKDEFNLPASLLLVAEHNNLIYGYLAFRVIAPEAELIRLVILPDQRRQGGADSLVRSGLRVLGDQGILTCFLEVRKSNKPAASLYDKIGFVRVGIRSNYYRHPGEDAIVMQKKLPSTDQRRGNENDSGS